MKSNSLPSGWKLLTVDDIKAPSEGAIAIGPFGSRMKAECYVPVGVPVIRGNNLTGLTTFGGDFVYVSDDTADSMRNCNAFGGDLVFPHRGAIGQVGLVPADGKRYMLSTSLMKLSCNREIANPRFLYFFFRSDAGRHELLKNASTVGTPGIGQPLSTLRSIRLPLPPKYDQDRIADILGTLDDKIELNRRMNETLEATARRLFRSWFIDFDAVHAKAAVRREHPKLGNAELSRRALPNMAPEIAELFPDSFEDSTLGPIPKGWKVAALNQIAEVIMGSSPPGDTYNDIGLGTPLVNGPVEFGERFTIRRKWTTQPGRLAQSNDLIFCVRGSTTGRRVISDGIYCLGRGVCAMRPRNGEWCFIHQLIAFSLERMLTRVSGSVFPNLNGPDLKQFVVVVPPSPFRSEFQRIVEPLMMQVAAKVFASESLECVRDSLLPRLLNGELNANGLVRGSHD